ncbi:AAA family ATPase [Rosistilla oblonga]|uniref:AAA family ATPase n=1 Tax=Rosistilla oblonga TaxID=2527990 RepID=UPI003A984762
MESPQALPRWALDLARFLPLKSQFLLSGNVRDRYPWAVADDRYAPLPLTSFLAELLRSRGIAHVLAFDPLNGFSVPLVSGIDIAAEQQFFSDRFELRWNDNLRSPASVARFFELFPDFVRNEPEPIAVLADFSSRYLVRPDLQTDDEHHWFTASLILSLDVAARPCGPDASTLFNPIVWIADQEGDLPPWFAVGNPRLRPIALPVPDRTTRGLIAKSLIPGIPGARQASEEQIAAAERSLVEQTHGLMLLDMISITELCRNEQVSIDRLDDGVRRFKLGVTENPWAKLDREKITTADSFVARRLKGQDHAVTKMLDIIKRSVIGLSGNEGRLGRPRGVAFLAGPTGTGKTELAKTVTELLFGDESAYIRFDMSEFAAEHSDQRLIGAPPGYVGYDTGGELTNAIREKPFSVVLFDEIEKAHPRILDKFLQVLDDGVLTSGRGERVYFSEAFLIFTSNLGLYRIDERGKRVPNATPADDMPSMQAKVRAEIDRFFKLEIGRPEILNRIGENIVVFDFIRDDVAAEIFDMMLAGICRQVETATGRPIDIEDSARRSLQELCLADLSNGGRGVRNQLEAHFINPLARALFNAPESPAIIVRRIDHRAGLTTVELA